MSAIDPDTIDTTQPPATAPTTAGVRGVFAAIKALFVTAAAEISALQAVAITSIQRTALLALSGAISATQAARLVGGTEITDHSHAVTHPISAEDAAELTGGGETTLHAHAGGGGGGGPTLSEQADAPTASLEPSDELTVTHPAVVLNNGAIRFSAQATKIGATSSLDVSNLFAEWENLNTAGATWVQDNLALGHFSTAPGARVAEGCQISYGEYGVVGILSITGDGTGPSSVELDGEISSTAINRISAVLSGLSPTYAGWPVEATPTLAEGDWTWGKTSTIYNAATLPYELTGFTQGVSVGTDNVRAAFTLDGETTWITHDGTGWELVDFEDVKTAGCTLDSDGWYASDGITELTQDDWDDLLALMALEGEDLDLRLVAGFRPTGDAGLGFSSMYAGSKAADLVVPLPAPTESSFSTGFAVERVSSTVALFRWSAGFSGTYKDFRVQTWT